MRKTDPGHTVKPGRSIIERMQKQMDKRRNKLQQLRIDQGVASQPLSPESYERALWDQALELGRYEGIAATLAIMRSSSVQHEIECSNERLGIE